MLDKVMLSRDRHHAILVFDTHSVNLHSDGNVVELMWKVVFEPSILLEERNRAEKTKDIVIESFLDEDVMVAAAA